MKITSNRYTNVEVDARIALHALVAAAHHPRSVATYGTYAGNDAANRAIPHGLGAVPTMVFICNTLGYDYIYRIVRGFGLIYWQSDTPGMGTRLVTQVDDTNFYVGDGVNHTQSANASAGGTTYAWATMG